jgi:arylsulfatase A-like enzyme
MPRAKCTLYDPGIEVALLMRWPAQGLVGGRIVEEMISNVDVAPTLLEALGLERLPTMHGVSCWPLLLGRDYSPRGEIFAEKTYHTQYEPMRAIRTDRHKLIANLEVGLRFDVPGDILASPIYPLMIPRQLGTRPPLELYDLDSDPWEEANVAEMPAYDGLRAELTGRLLRWMEETDDPLLNGPVLSPYLANALWQLRRT